MSSRSERRKQWDEVCTQCGLCCYQKEYRRGRLYINLNRPCPYLDTQSKLCMVYDNRFKICRDCKKVTMYHALFSSLMPVSCAYVQRYRKLKFLIPKPGIYGHRTRPQEKAPRR